MRTSRKQILSAAALVGLSTISAFSTLSNTHNCLSLRPYPQSTIPLNTFAGAANNDINPQHNDTTTTISSPSVSAQELRQISVTNTNGDTIKLGDMMTSDGTSIVVFLRHLGCFHCWSYVRDWTEALKNSNDNPNPIFVSIGDKDRLNAFLDKHPDISRKQMVVDGYDFEGYRQAGFGRFDETSVEDVEPKPITLGGIQGWWTFLTSFMPLAPVTPDMEFPEMLTPEGLFWVGGTMVIQGDEIVYRWDDRIAGDHPDASEVLAIAKKAAATRQ